MTKDKRFPLAAAGEIVVEWDLEGWSRPIDNFTSWLVNRTQMTLIQR